MINIQLSSNKYDNPYLLDDKTGEESHRRTTKEKHESYLDQKIREMQDTA